MLVKIVAVAVAVVMTVASCGQSTEPPKMDEILEGYGFIPPFDYIDDPDHTPTVRVGIDEDCRVELLDITKGAGFNFAWQYTLNDGTTVPAPGPSDLRKAKRKAWCAASDLRWTEERAIALAPPSYDYHSNRSVFFVKY